MTRLIIHNYQTRSIGRFRATGGAHDHKDCGCGCGGKGTCGHSHDSHAQAEVAIDVRYAKGGYGRAKSFDSRHYVIKDVVVNPRGRAPTPEFVRHQLGQQPDHRRMMQDGWRVDDVTGYYKGEHRDVGDYV